MLCAIRQSLFNNDAVISLSFALSFCLFWMVMMIKNNAINDWLTELKCALGKSLVLLFAYFSPTTMGRINSAIYCCNSFQLFSTMASIKITEKKEGTQYENMKMQQWNAFRFRTENCIMVFSWQYYYQFVKLTIRIEFIPMIAFLVLLESIWTDRLLVIGYWSDIGRWMADGSSAISTFDCGQDHVSWSRFKISMTSKYIWTDGRLTYRLDVFCFMLNGDLYLYASRSIHWSTDWSFFGCIKLHKCNIMPHALTTHWWWFMWIAHSDIWCVTQMNARNAHNSHTYTLINFKCISFGDLVPIWLFLNL